MSEVAILAALDCVEYAGATMTAALRKRIEDIKMATVEKIGTLKVSGAKGAGIHCNTTRLVTLVEGDVQRLGKLRLRARVCGHERRYRSAEAEGCSAVTSPLELSVFL